MIKKKSSVINIGYPKLISNLSEKYLAAIDEISDERNNGNGWWIYLKKPFFNTEMESRIIHEQQLTDCIRQLKLAVNKPVTEEQYFSKMNPQTNR